MNPKRRLLDISATTEIGRPRSASLCHASALGGRDPVPADHAWAKGRRQGLAAHLRDVLQRDDDVSRPAVGTRTGLSVQRWLQASGAMDSRIARLAGEAGLEERMLLRRFRKATDLATIDYCQGLPETACRTGAGNVVYGEWVRGQDRLGGRLFGRHRRAAQGIRYAFHGKNAIPASKAMTIAQTPYFHLATPCRLAGLRFALL